MSKTGDILVTGAAGFLGSHLVRKLKIKNDYSILALDDLSGGYEENIPDGVKFVNGSVENEELITRLFDQHDIRYVYHLAAYAAEGLSHFIRRFNYRNNLIGSVNLINSAVKHDIECFVFTSSIAVYGSAQVPMTEDTIPKPEDPYGVAKYAVEMDLKCAKEIFGLNYIIFRPHNVYGEYQNIGDKYRNVVGIFMNQILNNEPLTIFGNGKQQRAFSYVDDIIGPIAESCWTPEAYNRIFNIGADRPYSVNELADKVSKAMGVPNHPKKYLPARNEVEIAYSKHDAVKEVFNHQPQTSLEKGLERMAEWTKQTGARGSREFENIEINKNLPAGWIKKS